MFHRFILRSPFLRLSTLTVTCLGASLGYSSALQANQGSTPQAKPSFNYDAYTRSVEQVQLQEMQALIQESKALNTLASAACHAEAQVNHEPLSQWPALPSLQKKWLDTTEQWQRLQVFPLGPNNDVTVRLNINFWPDKKNLVERKARGLLQQGDSAELKQGGIALQGLTASEYLLFDPKHLKTSTPAATCHLLTQITHQSEENTRALLTRWQKSGFLVDWHDAALGNETFASTTQATGYLLSSLAEMLESIAKNKIYKPFRLNDEKALPNPYLAENWRSNQSLQNLATNFDQISHYYLGLTVPQPSEKKTVTVNGPDQLLRHLGFAEEADAIVAQLDNSQQTLNQLVVLGSSAYLSQEGKALAGQLHQNIKQLEQALRKPLPHFNLTQRFNSADGD